ncbi:cytochrome b [Salmonella enterica]|nr:cytochrome b [Salmonella enterica]EPE48593.1 cytochrome b561 [Salmonella enterica subsp. enterica serovar Paratyphi A str. GZ9A00052]
MQFKNTPQRYGVVSAALHWLTALVVYGMFALGLWIVTLSYYDGWYHQAPEIHKSIGILLMMALIVRIIWRLYSPPPVALTSYSRLTRASAAAGHLLLYLLLFAIIISGYLISNLLLYLLLFAIIISGSLIPPADGKPISVFSWFEIPATLTDAGAQADIAGTLHLWFAWSLVIISLSHGVMALKHHFIDKDDTLKRMTGMSSSDYGAQK